MALKINRASATLALAVVAFAAFGCTPGAGRSPAPSTATATASPAAPGPSVPAPPLVVSNATSLKLHLAVNGEQVGTAEPGAQLSVARGELPAYPWQVTVQTESGRELGMLEVAGDVQRTALPGGGTEVHGYATRIDLSCGRIDVSYGPLPLGPAGGGQSFAPDDCAP